MTAKILDIRNSILADASHRIAPAAFALLFGVFLVWGVAFAQSAELHTMAHDGRHSIATPCH